MLTADQLLEELLRRARALTQTEAVPVELALGRVLAQPQVSAISVPPLDNSAMDGYAVRAAECVPGARLVVSQRIAAGQVGEALATAGAARIFTGAPVPPGADAVVMQEHCSADGDKVQVHHQPKPGENIRRAGEDIRPGATILPAGMRLGAAAMGLAASVGLTALPVYRRLKVASFSTGNELVQPGTALGAGQIYNSNRYTLAGLVQGLGCEWLDLGSVPDTLAATLAALQHAAALADVVITSGGVSVGEEDHVKAAVEQLGKIDMWKVAMKPGKPLVYGRVGEADFIGLPGNPVSTLVTFALFARPFLLKRMGVVDVLPKTCRVKAAFDWEKPGERREFLRARLQAGQGGELEAQLFHNQSSGVLTSAVWADGLVDIDIGQMVTRGQTVRFIPFSEVLG
ncbi:molybdopterin molybdenumtransferase MoeA [Sulfuriferula plumbiphila]|uniref:Molybdopterin molybdenumtransferase n=1 Tax=Sulfuriferula plumbiphila TaxID=171865 RepID=A0A512LAL8_9PROT|nr:gephyrin-like molybdotransferase Glp [Sulfuriferula plumbiphila]BBP04931.1 molybdopterin molybdenumtransferase MoeA [Sulfuriferula plumbiphila]GEP31502.1 molybdopterin molybdenumtransferase MoeA [Sulfuriferula plumbiphila]